MPSRPLPHQRSSSDHESDAARPNFQRVESGVMPKPEAGGGALDEEAARGQAPDTGSIPTLVVTPEELRALREASLSTDGEQEATGEAETAAPRAEQRSALEAGSEEETRPFRMGPQGLHELVDLPTEQAERAEQAEQGLDEDLDIEVEVSPGGDAQEPQPDPAVTTAVADETEPWTPAPSIGGVRPSSIPPPREESGFASLLPALGAVIAMLAGYLAVHVHDRLTLAPPAAVQSAPTPTAAPKTGTQAPALERPPAQSPRQVAPRAPEAQPPAVDAVAAPEPVPPPQAALTSSRSPSERRWRRALARGRRHMEAGEHRRAVWALERAVQYKPDDPDTLVELGKASAADGKLRAASRAYRRALELSPGHAAARAALRQLR